MPVLSNARHEAFAQALAKGKSADAAYQAAGYKPNRHNAAAMARKEHIITRLSELQGMTAERVVIDRQWIITKLYENAVNNQEGNPAASNKAIELLAKIHGELIDRSENVNHNYAISDTPASEDDWSGEYATEH